MHAAPQYFIRQKRNFSANFYFKTWISSRGPSYIFCSVFRRESCETAFRLSYAQRFRIFTLFHSNLPIGPFQFNSFIAFWCITVAIWHESLIRCVRIESHIGKFKIRSGPFNVERIRTFMFKCLFAIQNDISIF